MPRKKKLPAPPTKRTMRPTDLSEKERGQLLAMIAMGTPIRDACHAIRLSPLRYAEWMDETSVDLDFVKFREDVLQADGQGVAQQIRTQYEGGRTRKNPDGTEVFDDRSVVVQGHRWLLERRRPHGVASRGVTTSGSPVHTEPGGPELPRPPDVEIEVAEQIVSVCEGEGIVIPDSVRRLLLEREPPTPPISA